MKMKIFGFLFIILINTAGLTNICNGQECKTGNIKGYNLTSMSRNYNLEIGETLTYEVVLFGGDEIIIKCFTENDNYPIRFKLKSVENNKVIYDNKYNNYLNELNLQLDHSELMAIEMNIELNERKLKRLKGQKACIGMAIYMQK